MTLTMRATQHFRRRSRYPNALRSIESAIPNLPNAKDLRSVTGKMGKLR
jgi:hypothetical protein